MARILGPNGQPLKNSAPTPPKPRNFPELVEEARRLYEKRDEREAFHKLCDAMLMCGQGVARNMNDSQLLLQEVRALNERLEAFNAKITPKE